MKRYVILTCVLLACVLHAGADEPDRTEQFVYTMRAFDGIEYVSTFVRPESHGIYMLADRDTVMIPRKSLVYYWAITDEWRVDTEALNRPLDGTIVVTEPEGTERSYERVPVTIFQLRGEAGEWKVAAGAEAVQAYSSYSAAQRDYVEQIREYNRRVDAYTAEARRLADAIVSARRADEDFGDLLRQFEALEEPMAPRVPATYRVPPFEPLLGFVVNLPEGTYQVRFEDSEGRTVQDSTHKVSAFSPLSTDQAGIEVIPADRWTRPVTVPHPDSVIYLNGAIDIYLRPFYQNRYNDYTYAKLRRNDAAGSPAQEIWVRHSDMRNPTIALRTSESTLEIANTAFTVEPLDASRPGYTIEPIPAGRTDAVADLIAHPIDIVEADWTRASIGVIDREGRNVPGGSREIRIVQGDSLPAWTIVLALWPLALLVVMRVVRTRSRFQGDS